MNFDQPRYIVCYGTKIIKEFRRLDDANRFASDRVETLHNEGTHKYDTFIAMVMHDDFYWSEGQ
jgi:hypothetical protein